MLRVQPNNIITIKTFKFWILIRKKERRKIAFHKEVELWTWMFREVHWIVVGTVKQVRRNNFFCLRKINTKEKSKWILSFMASANNCEAIKLIGFQITIMRLIMCTSSIHYKTCHMQSAIKSLRLVLKSLGKFWNLTLTLTLYQASHNCMSIVSNKNVFSKLGTNKQL